MAPVPPVATAVALPVQGLVVMVTESAVAGWVIVTEVLAWQPWASATVSA